MFSAWDFEVSADLVSVSSVMLLVTEELVNSDNGDLGLLTAEVSIGVEAGVEAIDTGSTLTSGSTLTGVLIVRLTMSGSDTSPGRFC